MLVGQKYRLKVKKVKPNKATKKVKWKSSNKRIATVSNSGVVKAKRAGTVKITAISKKNKKAKASKEATDSNEEADCDKTTKCYRNS